MHQATQAEIEMETQRARQNVRAYREAQGALDAAQDRARREALGRYVEESIRNERRRQRFLAPVRLVRELGRVAREFIGA